MRMRTFAVIFSVIVTSFAAEFQWTFTAHVDLEWNEWKARYGKTYEDQKEEIFHRNIWEQNRAFVDKHNAEAESGLHSHTVGLNGFSDWYPDDYSYLFNSPTKTKIPTFGCTSSSVHESFPDNDNLPDEVDWRKEGYVTAVRDQGFPWTCGSCWSFSATGSLEAQHFKATGQLVTLSQQNLLDCSFQSSGCEGGWPDYGFKYIIDHGIEAEKTYPYGATDESTCEFNPSNVVATMRECIDVTPRGDELALKKAVAHIGPISVGMDASQNSIHFYDGGIYDEYLCDPDHITHAVLVVGYGTENGTDYWLIKNSWGIDWGEEGYFRMVRNKDNKCGIATVASYPVV